MRSERHTPRFLELPERTRKPRRAGITHVLDRGLSPFALESLLITAGEHIDLIKLGWGTAYVSGAVADKVAICRDPGIALCPGGTLLEVAVAQGKVDAYVEWLHALGIDHVEVSNGSLPMAPERKAELIARLAGEFTVISEVGSKSGQDAVPKDWCDEMLRDLAAGAVLVIAEGRESGTVGLFDETGAVAYGSGRVDPARRRPRDGDLRGAAARAAGVDAAPRRPEREPRQHRRRGRDRAGDAAPRPALRHARPAAAGLILTGLVTDTAVMSRTARFGRADETAAAPVVVARQPILDSAENVIGYGLLSPSAPIADPRGATASVLVQSFADVGIDRLVGALPAYVSVTREFLLTVRPLPLAPANVVLEIDASGGADDVLLAIVRDAVADGFRVALDDFRHTAGSEALLAPASIVKLDVARLDGETLTGTVASLRGHEVALFAKNVATRAQYDDCRALGFDGFQGRFFAEPAQLTGSSAPTYRLRALSMLAARGDMTSFETLERVIVEDPGLSHKLVRLANSAFIGSRHPVGSIRQALMRLGSVAVRRWATLLVLAGVTDRPNHLLELGLSRARLCELIAMRDGEADAERAFTVGLFSVVDALLRIPMSQLLEELPFDDRTKRALTGHTGPEGRILGGVLAYECGDFEACTRSGVGLLEIARAYRQALDWTAGAAMQLA